LLDAFAIETWGEICVWSLIADFTIHLKGFTATIDGREEKQASISVYVHDTHVDRSFRFPQSATERDATLQLPILLAKQAGSLL
jgi:hypothetical protein